MKYTIIQIILAIIFSSISVLGFIQPVHANTMLQKFDTVVANVIADVEDADKQISTLKNFSSRIGQIRQNFSERGHDKKIITILRMLEQRTNIKVKEIETKKRAGSVGDNAINIAQNTASTINNTFNALKNRLSSPNMKKDLVGEINVQRKNAGVNPVVLDTTLESIAQAHAADMVKNDYFDSINKQGKGPFERLIDGGYAFKAGAESIAMGEFYPEETLNQILANQQHKKNFLDKALTHVGIGYHEGRRVFLFAAPAHQTNVSLLAGTNQTQPTSDGPSVSELRIMHQGLLVATNAERESNGLKPLVLNAILSQVAQGHASDMAKRNYFAHNSPEGLSPFDRMKNGGYTLRYGAENIAYGQRSIDEVMKGWMDSPGHRKNILSDKPTEIGFGYFDGYRVQVFGDK